MEEIDYLIILYDYYCGLFNESQRYYFEEYYFNNLSLGEISENTLKSRNAIHKNIKNVCNKLIEYENILKIYKRHKELKEIIDMIDDKDLKERLTLFYEG